ncbi:hypothetical protein RF55_11491 [Lasius niger]|uniref:Reverse transcriptase domain-containing protein n=1 Tax=Lasius niger TaxID=67767 RepID=A0A0J7KF81_LASNI|nr:hypothetical protein RF55_11491 [Lasius niger]
MERCTFNQTKQEVNESIAKYAARLKKLALHCNYTNLKEALRDQFVVGIRDQETRVTLFKTANQDFDGALKEAIARESAVKNATGSIKTLEKKGTQQEVFALKHSTHRKKTSGEFKANKSIAERSKGNNQGIPNDNSTSGARYYCCGKPNHKANVCRHRFRSCNFCERKGHLEAACRAKASNTTKPAVKFLENTTKDEESEKAGNNLYGHDFFPLRIRNVHAQLNNMYADTNGKDSEPMMIELFINRKKLPMEVDTGTFVTVISEKEKNENFANLEIKETSVYLRGYDSKVLEPIGKLENLTVAFKNKQRKLDCFVLPGAGPPLIGRQWLSAFGCWPLSIVETNNTELSMNKLNIDDISETIFHRYKELFGPTPGLFNRGKAKIYLKDKVKPCALKARHVPHALKPLIEQEINRLVKCGHLVSVESSEWATPIVPVIKNDGHVRICGDFKLTLNSHIIVDKYPLHKIDDIFAVLQGGEKLSQLDLSHAYMQIPVEKSCQEYLTIVTHWGYFGTQRCRRESHQGRVTFKRKWMIV